jgi:hypothetical protein
VYDIVGSWFTDVVLHSSINYRYEDATEFGRLHKDVAAAFSAHDSFQRSFKPNTVLICAPVHG